MTTKAQAVIDWVDERFPLTSSIKGHLTEYYAPKNFNFWYFFGSLALLVLVAWGVQAYFIKLANATMSAESIFFYMALSAVVSSDRLPDEQVTPVALRQSRRLIKP